MTSRRANNDETITERLEPIREEIRIVEKELAKYGFDPRRGIESYRINEIRELLHHSKNREETKRLLMKLIELQEKLYRKLYEMAGLKEMNIDTDTPEKNLLVIKQWLISGKTNFVTVSQSKFERALKLIIKALNECDDDCRERIISILQRTYKRDYDRYRVGKFILEICVDLHAISKEELSDIESKPIPEIVNMIFECARKIGKTKLAKVIEEKAGR